MKYSDNNLPLQCFMDQSSWAKGAKRNSTPVGILWHDTGAGNPTIKRYVQPNDDAPNRAQLLEIIGKNAYNNDWNHKEGDAGLNCWIGQLADGTVTTVQTGPWTTNAWGCGAGPKGSCNGYIKKDGKKTWVDRFWIQFEICDDYIVNKKATAGSEEHFNACYKEACEITAYLCQKFKIDPMGTVEFNGVTVPTILCHQDSYKYGLGSDHGDVYTWFKKHGKTMDDVRKDVAQLIKDAEPKPVQPEELRQLYCVRMTWIDISSQVGAYDSLESAITKCKAVGADYKVFDWNGNIVWEYVLEPIVEQPEKKEEPTVVSITLPKEELDEEPKEEPKEELNEEPKEELNEEPKEELNEEPKEELIREEPVIDKPVIDEPVAEHTTLIRLLHIVVDYILKILRILFKNDK